MFFINPEAFDYDPEQIQKEIYQQITSYDNERFDNLYAEGANYVKRVDEKDLDTIIEGLWGESGENIESHAKTAHIGKTIQELKERHKSEASSFETKYHMMVVLTDFLYYNIKEISEWQANPDIREPFVASFNPLFDENKVNYFNKDTKYDMIGYGVKYNKETKQNEIFCTPAAKIILQKSKNDGFYLDTMYPDFNTEMAYPYQAFNEENPDEEIRAQLNRTYLEDREIYDEPEL